jgi:molecular chaperone GrpE
VKHKTPDHEPHQEAPVDAGAMSKADERVAALEADVARLEDARLRAEADLQNVRRRAAREHEEAERRGEERVLHALFAVIDDLERARDAAGEESAVRAGIELVLQRAREELARLGVSPIHPHGEPFDPHAHDALLSAESDEHAAGHVSHVISPGYRRDKDGRVVRHARVQVSTGLGSTTEPGGEKRS